MHKKGVWNPTPCARNVASAQAQGSIWHTKGSLPLLTPDVERFTHHYIRGRLINTAGVFIHEIGGTENHSMS